MKKKNQQFRRNSLCAFNSGTGSTLCEPLAEKSESEFSQAPAVGSFQTAGVQGTQKTKNCSQTQHRRGERLPLSGEEKRFSLFSFPSYVCVLCLFSRAGVTLGSSLSRGCASYTDVTEHNLFKSAASQWCYIHFF